MRSVQAELSRSGMALSTLLAVLVGVWVKVKEKSKGGWRRMLEFVNA